MMLILKQTVAYLIISKKKSNWVAYSGKYSKKEVQTALSDPGMQSTSVRYPMSFVEVKKVQTFSCGRSRLTMKLFLLMIGLKRQVRPCAESVKFHGVLHESQLASHASEVDWHALFTHSMHVCQDFGNSEAVWDFWASATRFTHLSHCQIWSWMWLAHSQKASIKQRLSTSLRNFTYFGGAFASVGPSKTVAMRLRFRLTFF